MNNVSASRIAVMGAVAYDLIGKTDEVFDSSGPGLNCKVRAQQEFFGGCAGNIVYGLTQLGLRSLLLSCAGQEDFRRYAQHLGHDLAGVLAVQGAYCAKANIITDPNGVQFTAFSPGPTIAAEVWSTHLLGQPIESIDIFVCAPFPEPLMQLSLAATKLHNAEILNVWVPGQYADTLTGEQLAAALPHCDVLVGNAHEIAHIRKAAAESLRGQTIIETDGARPVRVVLTDGNQRTLPTPVVSPAVDPTGCGDAFVAGLMPALLRAIDDHGLMHWERNINTILRAGTAQAARCLRQRGAQTYGS